MLDELLAQYWDAAYAEGAEGRDHDTEDAIAQRTLNAINAEVKRMVDKSSRSPGCSKAGDLARELLPEVTAVMEELFSLYDDHESELPQRVNAIRQRLIVEDVTSR